MFMKTFSKDKEMFDFSNYSPISQNIIMIHTN